MRRERTTPSSRIFTRKLSLWDRAVLSAVPRDENRHFPATPSLPGPNATLRLVGDTLNAAHVCPSFPPCLSDTVWALISSRQNIAIPGQRLSPAAHLPSCYQIGLSRSKVGEVSPGAPQRPRQPGWGADSSPHGRVLDQGSSRAQPLASPPHATLQGHGGGPADVLCELALAISVTPCARCSLPGPCFLPSCLRLLATAPPHTPRFEAAAGAAHRHPSMPQAVREPSPGVLASLPLPPVWKHPEAAVGSGTCLFTGTLW